MISGLQRTTFQLLALSAIAFAAGCSGASETNPIIPGIGNEVPLARVDNQPLPVTVASSATDQTSVIAGKATLGEAIASGDYSITLVHQVGNTAQTSTVSGNVVFDWGDGTVSAIVDLGGSLGKHTFLFSH
jgi:hypothetical protein